MKVSIVIAAYNCGSWILDTINDVLGQTIADFELIVVDDGSTDDTAAKVRGVQDPRVLYVHQENFGGPGKPRNMGLARAQGRYVTFLDHDDRWYPTRLERVLACFDADPTVDVVCHDYNVVMKGKTLETFRCGPASPRLYVDMLLEGACRLAVSATTLKTEVVRAHGGFNESKDFISAEDFDLWLRLAHAGAKFCFLNETLGEYTLSGSNLSKNLEKHHRARQTMYDDHLKRFPAELEPYRKQIAGMHSYAFGRSLQTSGDFARARDAYWTALKEGQVSLKLLAAWTMSTLRIKG